MVTSIAQKAVLETFAQRGDACGIRVPHQASAVPVARRQFLDDLALKNVQLEVCGEAAVVVSELLSNAIRHAGPVSLSAAQEVILLRWQVKNGTIDIEVTDGGGSPKVGSLSPVRPAKPHMYSTHGRGLRIVRSLAHEWGVIEDADRRTVWAALGGPSRRRHRLG